MEQKQKTILVVEDEAPLQEAIKLKLSKTEFRYLPATTAEQALEILKTEKPDLVWLDLLLPGMGGFAFLEVIRKDEKWRNLPVVVCSVSGGPEKIKRAFELNVLDYLVKSQYKIQDIVKRMKFYLESKPNV